MFALRLAALNQTMERGLLVAWCKAEGDAIDAGDEIYEVETDKANVLVEATRPGRVARIVVAEGQEVAVGECVGIVASPEETFTDDDVQAFLLVELARSATSDGVDGAVAETTDASTAEQQAPTRSIDRPVTRVTPRARAMALELGVDLETIEASDADRGIRAADVLAGRNRRGLSDPKVRERRPVKGTLRTMSEVVTRSWTEVPQFVQQVSVDATNLLRRKTGLAKPGFAPSLTVLVLEAVVRAAVEVPDANASFRHSEVLLFDDVNVSVAVATDAGLVVPVLRSAQEHDVVGLTTRLEDMAQRARTRSLDANDLSGGTITVSNLGAHGVETGFPMVTAPQAVVVFVGALVKRAVVIDDEIEVRPIIGVAVGFDHRVLDGATAASFTSALRRQLELPPN